MQIIETDCCWPISELEKRIDRIGRLARADTSLRPELAAMEQLKQHLDAGKAARHYPRPAGDPILPALDELHLLSDKPLLYCANLGEDELANPAASAPLAALQQHAAATGAALITLAAQLEAELVTLPAEERSAMLAGVWPGRERSRPDGQARL